MKISLPKHFPGVFNAVLPLVPVEEDSNLSKVDTCQFTLLSNPGTMGAATYKIIACILKGNAYINLFAGMGQLTKFYMDSTSPQVWNKSLFAKQWL